MNHSRITPIDKILDLEQDSYQQQQAPEGFQNKMISENFERNQINVQHKIRPPSTDAMKYGMNGGNTSIDRYFGGETAMTTYNPYQQDPEMYIQSYQQPNLIPIPQVHCIDIIDHVSTCKLCSHFYKHDSPAPYVIIIIVLLIFIILLSKKIIEKF